MTFCVKRLILEVESRPLLWDSRTKEYSDRSLKREAWEDLCATLVPNFFESSVGERSGIVATMQRKWKSVRDAFLRELKKNNAMKPGPGGLKYTKPYAYYDNLIFLKPVCETRPRKEDDDTVSNSNETMIIEYDDNDDSDNGNPIINVVHSVNENKAQTTLKRKQSEETEESVFNLLAEHIKNKRKKDTDDNPDRQFLLSLLPDLQSMDDSVKFDLKFEIMSIIKRFKDENVKFLINTAYQQE